MKTLIKRIEFFSLAILPCVFIMASCEKELIGPSPSNTPTTNFQYFWRAFDERYGLFDVKKIKWDSVYGAYNSRVNDQMNDDQLYQVLTEMMVILNDNHLNLYPTNGTLPVFPGGVLRYANGKLTILKVQEDYDWEVTKKYLLESHELSPTIKYGRLGNNLGYINISGHGETRKSVEKNMEKLIADLNETKGIVVDVRGDYGGMDAIAQLMAGHFASSRKLYMTARKRNGKKHSDFTAATEWYVEPTGNTYTKPIVVLTSRFTQSAGETFTLAMKEFDHVKVLGDTTAGSFSDNPNTELPNGWMFSISVGDYRAANGLSFEGVGLAPDEFLRNSKEDLLVGRDRTLEKAIEVLK